MLQNFIINYPFLVKVIFLLLAGFSIRLSLIIAGQRWANTYHHLGSYLLLPLISLVISSIIRNDIALSLGMIGALSIVRFRNPVKSPFELVMFFALVTLGVCAGVDFQLSQRLFLVIVLVIIGIRIGDIMFRKFFNLNIFQYSFAEGNLSFTLEIESSEEIEEIVNYSGLLSSYDNKLENKFYYRLIFKNKNELLSFKKKLSKDNRILTIRSDM